MVNPMAKKTRLADDLKEALIEVIEHAKGNLALETRVYRPKPDWIAAQRKRIAKSRTEFERRYGVPAASLKEWERGRRAPDLAVRSYLAVIFADPEGTALTYAKSRRTEADAAAS